MRMLATLEHPTAGDASVCGENVIDYPLRVRGILGWMPDNYGTYDNMSVLDYLDFFARAHGFKGADRQQRVADVMDFTELGPLSGRLIGELSKGMGQRLCLGRALIHDPDILIMDEPAAGLDPRARVDLKNLIRVLAEDGKTIFISSHILSELEEMCDDLLFINAGRIIHHGSAETLKRNKTDATLINVSVAADPEKLHQWAETAPDVTNIEATKNGARFESRRPSRPRSPTPCAASSNPESALPNFAKKSAASKTPSSTFSAPSITLRQAQGRLLSSRRLPHRNSHEFDRRLQSRAPRRDH